MPHLPFSDRDQAGRLLADHLESRKLADGAVILALPRGGVPVGFAIARRLRLPLDVLVVRKLGLPWQPEIAMGAIAGEVRVLDEKLIGDLGIPKEEIDRITDLEQAVIRRREELYRGGQKPLNVIGQRVILVDDGLATGSTMAAAARCVARLNPARVTVAVPVGSREACARLQKDCDDLVCLAAPEPFVGVSRWYGDFGQTSDAEVERLLARNRGSAQPATRDQPIRVRFRN